MSQRPPSRPTDNFRRQHQELMELAADIGGRLSPARVEAEAPELRRLFAQFAGRLTMHARMENDALYPRLMAHEERAVRDQATILFSEVGGIYDAFGAFLSAWPSAQSIEASPNEFIRQAMKIFRTLGKRMMREEHDLYPMVDRVDRLDGAA